MSWRPALLVGLALSVSAPLPPISNGPDVDRALGTITANDIRGQLSFLASDLLEGRGTPSRGLDLAAEYLASELRAVGVAPGVGSSYFQEASWPVGSASPTATVRNVIGIIPGRDPKLKDTYLMVSGHYDHLGQRGNGPDTIYNGANDDASGCVGVLQVAKALASMKQAPRRTIVFAFWFGEERGLVGSRYYGEHPIFPIGKTVAMVNLEQIGRTDDTEGPRVGALSMTGFDYSDVGPIFAAVGKKLLIEVSKHPRNSDAFFARSDNAALARQGVPAHTLCTAFEYPDYHGLADTWDKVDAANMARVLRVVTVGVLTLADWTETPKWNMDNPKAERFAKARKGG